MNRKKVTNEDVKRVIREAADKIREEIDRELVVTRCLFSVAEDELLATFTDEQKILYKKYLFAKQNYDKALANKNEICK